MTAMKHAARVALVAFSAASWACGGDTPAPQPQDDTSPEPAGVYGQAPTPSQGIPSVVTLRPVSGDSSAPPAEVALLDQLGLAFTPKELVVRVGQPLEIANSETLAHNVHLTFIDNDSSVFIADMDPADRTTLTLDMEGGYDVVCDVHPGMRAFIYVTSAPYAAFADQDGRFLISGVPEGSYTASVWSASADLRSTRTIQVSGSSTELDLSSSR